MQKTFRTLFLVVAVLLSPGSALWLESAEAPLPKRVILTVKTGSLKELSDKIMQIARQVEPGPQVESMPFLLGAMLGDPMLQGVEAGRNIGVAMVKQEEEYVPVLLARLPEESPYRQSLPGYGLSLSDYEGWTFGTLAPVEPDALGDLRGSLVEWVQGAREHDIELHLNGPEVSRYILQMESEVRTGLAGLTEEGQDPEMEEAIWSLVKTIAGEFRVASSIGFGLGLDAESITQHGHITADEDTALGRFFSADHTVSIAAAEWIEADHPVAYLARVNSGAIQDYLNYFSAKAEAAGGAVVSEVFSTLRHVVGSYAEFSDGHTAGYLRFEAMAPRMVQLMDSRYDDDSLRDSLKAVVEMVNQPVLKGFSRDSYGEVTTRAELLEVEQRIGDHAVHAMRTFADFDEDDDLSEADREFYAGLYEQIVYYVQVGDYLLMAYDYDDLLKTATSIAEGERPDRSVAGKFREERGLAGQWIINPAPFLATAQAFGGGESEEAGTELPPARGEVWAGENGVRGRFEIPVELIAAAYREGRAMVEGMGIEEFDFEEDLNGEVPNQ